MSIIRVLADRVEGDRVYLPSEEIHHLVRVRRADPEMKFEALDGKGQVFTCLLKKEEEGNWFGQIEGVESGRGESPLQLTLALALVRKDLFEWACQKATELGVAQIWPLVTERTEIRLDDRRTEKKVERWRRIVREAVKQSGRSIIPEVSYPMELEEALQVREEGSLLVLDEGSDQALKPVLQSLSQPIVIFVGPEGGWSPPERELFRFQQASFASLGNRILRAETAPLAILSILQYELGDLG